MKKGILFLNGKNYTKKMLQNIDFEGKTVICADGAYKRIKSYIEPDILIGDFDSLKLSKYSFLPKTKIIKFSKDKNHTDGYLAIIQAQKENISELEIYGFSGGRLDHEYNNFSYLTLCDNLNIKAVFADLKFTIRLISDFVVLDTVKGKIISIVPFSSVVHIISTKGLKFPADGLVFDRLNPLNKIEGISNYAADEKVEIKLKEGKALIFMQR